MTTPTTSTSTALLDQHTETVDQINNLLIHLQDHAYQLGQMNPPPFMPTREQWEAAQKRIAALSEALLSLIGSWHETREHDADDFRECDDARCKGAAKLLKE